MIKVAKVIGANTDFLTSQAFILPKNPYLALIISAQGEDIFTKVRQIAPLVEESFYPNEEEQQQEKDLPLSQRISQVLEFIKNKLKNETETAEEEGLGILIASWKENVLYIKAEGQNPQVYLLRDGKVLKLIPEGHAGQLVSGYIKEGDKILLINSSRLENSDIEKLLNSDQDSLQEEADILIRKYQSPDPFAAVLIQNISETQEITAKPVQNLETPYPLNPQKKRPVFKAAFSPVFIKIRSIFYRALRQKRQLKITLGVLLTLLVLFGSYYGYKIFTSSKVPTQTLSTAPSPTPPTDTYQITDWPLFLSLDLIKNNFSAKRLSFSLGKVLLLDDNERSLVLLDLSTKKNTILAGKTQLGDAKFASLNGSNAFVYSQDKGILKIDTENSKLVTVSKKDEGWGQIVDIFGFGSNIYALDSTKNQIWKYVPIASGYADKTGYIKEGQNLDFAGAKRLQIDYSVWVLKSGPEIFRLTAGSSDNFSVGGLDKPLQDLNNFFVGEGEGPGDENSFAYFLDSQNSRLVLLSKNGKYRSQYIGDKFKTASDFAVDEENKKLYLLESGKIYQIDLK